jgi:hypothetical protein
MIEKLSRLLCTLDGYDPDRLESGSVYGLDGMLRNGDPAHFLWRQYAKKAKKILAGIVELRKAIDWDGETGK